jgi:DUF917 family protein
MENKGLRSIQDIEDFARGTNFLSASGGGPPEEAIKHLKEDLEQGFELTWISLEDLPDDASAVTASFSGSIAPERYHPEKLENRYGVERRVDRPLVAAVEALKEFTGKDFDTMVAIEIGGNNTGHALDTAANMGLRIVDADYAGRAIPEASCITPNVFGIPIYPMACVNRYGDTTYLKNAQNNEIAERLVKYIALGSFGHVGCAGICLEGREVKKIAVPGTLTECLLIGRAIREARERGRDPVQAVIQVLDYAWILFRGTVINREWESREGYMWGEHEVGGEGAFSGQLFKLWFKNENHATWLNGEFYVARPDIIEVVDTDTGEPLVNTHISTGQRVTIVGIKRRPQFDNASGLAILGPAHWGFEEKFRPIEILFA